MRIHEPTIVSCEQTVHCLWISRKCYLCNDVVVSSLVLELAEGMMRVMTLYSSFWCNHCLWNCLMFLKILIFELFKNILVAVYV